MNIFAHRERLVGDYGDCSNPAFEPGEQIDGVLRPLEALPERVR